MCSHKVFFLQHIFSFIHTVECIISLFFLLPSSSPLDEYTIVCLFILLLMDIWVMFRCFCESMDSYLLHKYLKMEMPLGKYIHVFIRNFQELLQKVFAPFYTPISKTNILVAEHPL